MSYVPVKVSWKKFARIIPSLVTEDIYNAIKSKELPLFSIEFGYWKEFSGQIIMIPLLFFGIYIPIIGIYIGVSVILLSIGFIISSVSYIDSYYQSKKYINVLNEAIYYSDSYKVFCTVMADIDRSYQLQLKRIETNDDLP
jgi:hypothetical protein